MEKSTHVFHILWENNNHSLSYMCECDFGLNLERFACLLAVHTFTSVILNGLHQHNEPIIYWANTHLKHKSI